MTERIREWMAPAYLFACIVIGGSAQGLIDNALLQLAGIAIIVSCLWQRPAVIAPRRTRWLTALLVGALALIALQVVPLPPVLWHALGNGALVDHGARLLGVDPGWRSLSMTPFATLSAATALIPPAAMFLAVLVGGPSIGKRVATLLLAGTLAAILLGILQVSSADPLKSPWYLYPIGNFGVATGFFANGNHMASLQLCAMAYLAAFAVSVDRDRREEKGGRWLAHALLGGGIVLLLTGLLLNGSLAGYGLAMPVVLGSLWIAAPLFPRFPRKWLAPALAVAVAAGLFLAIGPLNSRLEGAGSSVSVATRQQMVVTSFQAARDFAPAGSGIGSFSNVYRLYEDPDTIDRVYINHAHNDYLELLVEGGLPALALILGFLCWFLFAARRVLTGGAADEFAKAAILTSSVLLIHSLVDFPLRTAAMSALFGGSLAMMLVSRKVEQVREDWRATRHVVIE